MYKRQLRERLVQYKGLETRRWPLHEDYRIRSSSYAVGIETSPCYEIVGTNIVFRVGIVTQVPPAVDPFEIWYIFKPVAVTAAVDPVISSAYFPLLEAFAMARLFGQSGDEGMAQQSMTEYQAYLNLVLDRAPSVDGRPGEPVAAGGESVVQRP